MIQKIERVRAHHGMCFCYYKGKGYSSDFTRNMWEVLDFLRSENPEVQIVDRDDSVCAGCPNLIAVPAKDFLAEPMKNLMELPARELIKDSAKGMLSEQVKACITAEKVARYDRGVLDACGLNSGDRMHWLDFQALVQEKVISAGKRQSICGDCSWNELCK